MPHDGNIVVQELLSRDQQGIFDGLAALLSMLNACSTGVVVVNIDNGFGAAQFAHLILKRLCKENESHGKL